MRVIAVYGQWSFPALRCHVILVVLIVVCRQFGFWQDPLGQDESSSAMARAATSRPTRVR
jgi:hypothetical protein